MGGEFGGECICMAESLRMQLNYYNIANWLYSNIKIFLKNKEVVISKAQYNPEVIFPIHFQYPDLEGTNISILLPVLYLARLPEYLQEAMRNGYRSYKFILVIICYSVDF